MDRKLNIVEMSALPKSIDRFNAILVKIPATYLVEIDELTQKFTGCDTLDRDREWWGLR